VNAVLALARIARRLAAVRLLDWKSVPVRVVDRLVDALVALRAERDENTCRKDFLPSEAVAVGESLEALERAAAKQRQQEGRRRGGKSRHAAPSLVENFHEAETAKTRDKVGEVVGMSGITYEQAKGWRRTIGPASQTKRR
jgi:ParB-like chromosome segregation protein Spo0J